MRFKNKTLLVTGGTQGIGLEVALCAAKEGAQVTICGRTISRGDEAIREAAHQGLKLEFIACDVQNEADANRVVSHVIQKCGVLNFAFNNAGITAEHAKLADTSTENWQKVMMTNIWGTYLSMRAQIASMLKTQGGAIVNTSSAAGVMAIGGQSAYVASKAAIIGLTQSAAIDYANASQGCQIRINAVAPGPIMGGMNDAKNLAENPARTERKIASTAMRRFGTGSEVASTVLWLLSDESSYTTGAVIPIDGGYSAGKF
jgi:NAD(P)-dependent dehydrogenase (short-subunit alcohol dehydrogenase family)